MICFSFSTKLDKVYMLAILESYFNEPNSRNTICESAYARRRNVRPMDCGIPLSNRRRVKEVSHDDFQMRGHRVDVSTPLKASSSHSRCFDASSRNMGNGMRRLQSLVSTSSLNKESFPKFFPMVEIFKEQKVTSKIMTCLDEGVCFHFSNVYFNFTSNYISYNYIFQHNPNPY